MARSVPNNEALERALLDLGSHLSYPPTPDLVPGVTARLTAPRPRHALLPRRLRPAVVLAVLAVLFSAALLSPRVRAAAAWLGVRGVRIILGERPAGTPRPSPSSFRPSPFGPSGTGLDLGTPATLEGARAAVPFRILVPRDTVFPEPKVYLAPLPEGSSVVLTYPAGRGFPPAPGTGLGLLVTEFRGSLERAFFQKFAGSGTGVTAVTVNGEPGYWIDGEPHEILYIDPEGTYRSSRSRLAGNTLVWEQDKTTFRLEGAFSKDQAQQLAATMR